MDLLVWISSCLVPGVLGLGQEHDLVCHLDLFERAQHVDLM